MSLKMRVTAVLGVTAATALMLTTGCHSPSGGAVPRANGSLTYHSTEMYPKTVILLDLRTNEELFAMDIPPGKQLTLDFVQGAGDDPSNTPDLMRWQVFDVGTRIGRLENSLTVPAASARRLDMSIRSGIEPMPQTAQRPLRTDEVEDRPDWWTPEGGELPERRLSELYDN